jgi:hypothetical protein
MKVFLLYRSEWTRWDDYGDTLEGVFSTLEKASEEIGRQTGKPVVLDENDSTEPANDDGVSSYYYIEEREVDKVDAG